MQVIQAIYKKLVRIALVTLVLSGSSCKAPKLLEIKAVAHHQTDTLLTEAENSLNTYQGSAPKVHDLLHIKLEVAFDWAKQHLMGKATLTLKPHFYPSQKLTLDARGMDLHEIRLVSAGAKTNLDYTYDGEQIQITLDRLYNATDTFQVYIAYTAKPNELKKKGGSLAITDARGLFFINPDGKEPNKPRQIWTQGETQSNSVWFPCIDKPNQKITQEIYITTEKQFTTLSNGKLMQQEEHGDGTRTDYWRMDLPHSVYLVMMAIGDFTIVKDTWRDKEVSYYVEKEYAPFARATFGKTPEMMEYFSQLLGVPFAWPKYAQVVVRDYVSGAMENTTATLFGDYINQNGREMLDHNYEDIIAHELFHHWFGDLVTCESWSNLPLNESFADYAEYLWLEHKYGRTIADGHMHRSFAKYLGIAEKKKEVNLVRYFYEDKEDMFDANTYEKGGAILHYLRSYIGDKAFFTALNRYLTQNKFKNTEMAQLRQAFEEVTGEDLNWFFNQWFFSAGNPKLEITHAYDNKTHHYTLHMAQRQNLKQLPSFKLPMTIDLYDSKGIVNRKKVVMDKPEVDFTFEFAEPPLLVNVDAEKVVPAIKTEFGKSNAAWMYQYFHAPLFEDRYQSLVALTDCPKSPEFRSVYFSAIKDTAWEIRLFALNNIEKVIPDSSQAVKQLLVHMLNTDPKSSVRSSALQWMEKQFPPKDMLPIYQAALKDSSFLVVGDALSALAQIDISEALQAAKKFENEDDDQLILDIMSIYADKGTDTNNTYFIKVENQLSGHLRLQYVQDYGDFLLRCKEETIQSSLEVLGRLSNDNEKYVKFYARKVLKDLLSVIEKRETKEKTTLRKELKARLTDLIKNSET